MNLVLDTNALFRLITNREAFLKLKRAHNEGEIRWFISYELLAELKEHVDVIVKLALKHEKRADCKLACEVVAETLLELATLEFGSVEPRLECLDALKLVASRDPDDVHVASLAINVAPSVLVSDDKKAFDEETKRALNRCGVEVVSFGELVKRLSERGK